MAIAPIQKRILAAIIDLVIFLSLFLVIYIFIYLRYQTFKGQNGSGYSYSVVISGFTHVLVFIGWLLFITITEFNSGQSIGKHIVKIKVIKEDSGKTTIRDTFLRHLFDIVDIIPLVGPVAIFRNKNRQRLGDLIARTTVVRR